MKKLLITACLFAFLGSVAFAQDEEPERKGFDRDKLFFGGNFGLAFGSASTLVNVSPQVGYRFNRYFAAGAGVNFIYSSYKYSYTGASYDYQEQYGVTGLNVFGRFYPIDFLFVQAQPEANYVWGKYHFYNGEPDVKMDSKIVPSVLGGVGGAIPMGRGAFIIMVQYDLLQQTMSPYGNKAFFNFGYNIGL
jgi:hypothetical protein